MINYKHTLIFLLLVSVSFSMYAQVVTEEEVEDSEEVTAEEAEDALEAIESALNDIQSTVKKHAREDEIEPEKGWFKHTDSIGLYSEDFDGFSLLDGKLDDYSVFITGENHTYTESNARLWLKMIKYLHKNAGVRNIMFEYGYSYGVLINEYLETGDSTLFSSVDQFAYIEYSNTIEDLKKFNDSLPEDEKLYFAAIDIERGAYPIAKMLSLLLPEDISDAHDSISVHLESIASLASYNDYKLDEQDEDEYAFTFQRGFAFKSEATLDLVHENFLKFEPAYKTVLGSDFDQFRNIIVNKYRARKKWKSYDEEGAIQEYIFRESYMHQIFLEEAAAHPGNWFGQFGRCHTTLSKQSSNSCNWFEFNSLASRIEGSKSGAYKDKVLSMAIMYENDRNMGYQKDSLQQYFDDYFEIMEHNSVVLFDLEQDETLNNGFRDDFKYMILNTYSDRGEVYEYLEDYVAPAKLGRQKTVTLSLDALSFDLEELNRQIFNSSNAYFSNLAVGYGLNGSISGRNRGLILTGNFTNLVAQGRNIPINPSTNQTVSLGGYSYGGSLVYNFLKRNETVDVYAGYAINRAVLKIESSEYLAPLSNLFATHNDYKYKSKFNSNLLVAGMNVHLGSLTVGGDLGYYPPSYISFWKHRDVTNRYGPVVSTPSFALRVRGGINF